MSSLQVGPVRVEGQSQENPVIGSTVHWYPLQGLGVHMSVVVVVPPLGSQRLLSPLLEVIKEDEPVN